MLRTFKKLQRYASLFSSRYFRNRNIIVVCEGGVKHYPVSSTLQVLGILGTMGLLSWVSYSTGSYLAARTILAEKERKIETTTLANRRMEEQFALLRHDLLKLQEKTDTLDQYESFVVNQHSNAPLFGKGRHINDKELTNLSRNLLQERIDYLENVVDELKKDRETLVTSLRSRTQDRISVFEDIINETGLNLAKLSKHPKPVLKIREVQTSKAEPAGETTDFTSQGGPYVPENPMTLGEEETLLFQDIDHMVMLSDIVRAMPLATPMPKAQVSSTFGRRLDPINKSWAIHRGIDFVGKTGSRVMATSDGVVTFAGRGGAYGFMVEVDHGYGVSTRYAHLSKLHVQKDARVRKGQVIGTQGNTGRSTGAHLHYEIRFNKTALNPEKFIKAGQQDVF